MTDHVKNIVNTMRETKNCFHNFKVVSIDSVDMTNLRGTAKCTKCGFTVEFTMSRWGVIDSINHAIEDDVATLYVDYDREDELDYFEELEKRKSKKEV